MKARIETILLSLTTAILVLFIGLNVPARYFDPSQWFRGYQLGSWTLTDISSTDRLSDYPTTQNANNTAIELQINNILGTTTNSTITELTGLTTADSLTSAASLATVGTITTGTWNGDTVAVANGGTGSTTLSQFHILLGSSTNAIGIVSGLGTSGDFLQSQGAGLPPIWQAASVNLSDSYAWTGAHTWTQILAASAAGTSTFSGGLYSGYSIAAPFFSATSTTATTTLTALHITGFATTTDINIGGKCIGCLNGYEIKSTSGNFDGGTPATYDATVTCSTGKVPIGGGHSAASANANGPNPQISAPSGVTGWRTVLTYTNGDTSAVTVYAICVNP